MRMAKYSAAGPPPMIWIFISPILPLIAVGSLEARRASDVRIRHGDNREPYLPAREKQDGRRRAGPFQESAAQSRPQWVKAKRDESPDAVDSALQSIRNQREPVAELHDIIRWADKIDERRDNAQSD